MQGPGSFANVIATTVVVDGPSDGVYIYNGAAALGTLIESHTPLLFTGPDPFGNGVVGGDTTYTNTGGIFYAQRRAGFAVAQLFTAASAAGPYAPVANWQIAFFNSAAGHEILLQVPGGASVDISDANGLALLGQLSATSGSTQLTVTPSGVTVNGSPFTSTAGTSSNPTLVTTDTWHTMTPLQNSWAAAGAPNAPPQYRLTTDNEVEIVGTLNGVAATATQFFNLPAPYRPALRQAGFASGATGNVLAGRAPFIQLDTAGNLTLTGAAALPAAGVFVFSGKCPLDLV